MSIPVVEWRENETPADMPPAPAERLPRRALRLGVWLLFLCACGALLRLAR
jgi:hypothetical protein